MIAKTKYKFLNFARSFGPKKVNITSQAQKLHVVVK